MPIPEETIRRVRESVDIVEIISEYVSLQKRGSSNFFGLCPFHDEKTPSFSVHQGRQTYHCFGCGEGGNVFSFLMKIEGVEFPDAVRRLAERGGVTIDEKSGRTGGGENDALYRANELALKYYHYRLTEMTGEEDVKFARDYLEKRGIGDELISTFQLGLAPPGWDELIKVAGRRKISPDILAKAGLARRKERGGHYDWFRGRLMFPIVNPSGRTVAFGGRILREDPDRPQPKYVNTPDTPIYHKGKLLYALPQARGEIRQRGEAILVEGYTDVIALHRAGFEHAVAGLGTALTHDQAALLLRFGKRVTLLYDSDTAGNIAAFRGADVLVGAGLETRIALMPEGEDPDTLIQSGGAEAMEQVLATAKPLVDFKIDFFRRQGGLDTPERRSEATRALVDTLRRIQDPIHRRFTMHEVAEKLNIDERVLAREIEQARRTSTRVASSSPTPESRSMERFEEMLHNLLWVLVNHPERASEVFAYFHSSDLGDHPIKPVFELLEAAYIEGETVGEADLYDALGDKPKIHRQLGDILNRRSPDNPSYLETVVREAPMVLKRHGLERELAAVSEELRRADTPELARRFQDLRSELKALDDQLREM